MLIKISLAIQLLSAVFMIGLVLIQHGRGADAGASFGTVPSSKLLSATARASFLSRFTAACAGVFFICTLILAHLGHLSGATSRSSILESPAAVSDAVSSVPVTQQSSTRPAASRGQVP